MAGSRFGRIAGRSVLVLATLALAGLAFVYGKSEWILRKQRAAPLEPFPSLAVQTGSPEGRRLAVLVGCLQGCHGPAGEGGKEEADGIFSATAPTLSAVLPDYSDPELARLVRFGVKRDGKSALGMPSGTFYPIDERDLALIFAHLRALPPLPPVPRERTIEPLGRLALALGEWQASADAVDRSIPRWGAQPRETPFERGRYWASIVCSECHGLDFRGMEYLKSPPLSIVSAYDLTQFERLLRTGEHLSGRTDGLMSEVAREAFFEFTDQEIADVHAYFLALREELEVSAPG